VVLGNGMQLASTYELVRPRLFRARVLGEASDYIAPLALHTHLTNHLTATATDCTLNKCENASNKVQSIGLGQSVNIETQ
jgi:hypothetical protein